MSLFLTALRFLTRFPLPAAGEITPADAARSMVAFPLVGGLIGLLLAAASLVMRLLWPEMPAAALLLALWVMLSGGLHLDGFADSCDGLWAAVPPARRLEILRDVHPGVYGVVGLILLLLLKFSALVGLMNLEGLAGLGALILAPLLGRWAMVYAAWRYPYARRGPGLGQLFRSELRAGHLAGATAIAAILALSAGFPWGLAALPLAWLTTTIIAGWACRRLGGLTGDVYGMLCELNELILLLAVVTAHRLITIL